MVHGYIDSKKAPLRYFPVMPVSCKLRKAQPDEANILTQLYLRSKAYWGYSDEFMQLCRDELKITSKKLTNDDYYHVVAHIQDKVVGFYSLERLSGVECELEAMFVEPGYIGTGVGKKLMRDAKKRAAEMGYKTLVIQSDPNAANFYRNAGGNLVGRKESLSVPGRFLPLLEIDLTADHEI